MLSITKTNVLSWAKKAGIIGVPVGTLIFLYAYAIGAIIITGYSGDSTCAGTVEEPCLAQINFTVMKNISISKNNESMWLFNTDKRLKKLDARYKCGSGNWKVLNFSKSTKFTVGQSCMVEFSALKNNPSEKIKWSWGFENTSYAYVDPFWYGVSGTSMGNSYASLSSNNRVFVSDFEDSPNASTTSNPYLNVSGYWNFTNTTNNAGVNTMVLSIVNNSGYSQLDLNKTFSGAVSAVVSARTLPNTDGLVLYLPSDEGSGTVAYDKSGFGNNGTLTNMNGGIDNGTSGWTSSGRYGNAVMFDSINDVITVNHSTSLNLTSAGTMVAWLKWLPQGYANNGRPIDKNGGYYMEILDSIGRVDCGWSGLTDTYQTGDGTALTAGIWSFVACEYNGTAMNVFQDGVLKDSEPSTGTIASTNLSLRIGGDLSTRAYNGTIDEVKIYNRSLSPTEISAEYNRTVGFYYGGVKYSLNATYDWQTYNIENMPGTGNFSLYVNGSYTHYFDNLRVVQLPANTTNSTQNSGLINPTDNITVAFLPNSSHVIGDVKEQWLKNNVLNYTTGGEGSYWSFDTGNSTYTPDNGLAGWGNNGTVSGATWTPNGRQGGAYRFNGFSQQINISNSQTLNLTTAATISMWVRWYPQSLSANGRAVDKNGKYYIEIIDATGRVDCGWNGLTNNYQTGDNTELTAGVWAFIACQYNGTNLNVYKDGILKDSEPSTGTISVNTAQLIIGSDGGTTRYFNGTIDEVRIINRSLSADEVWNLYQSTNKLSSTLTPQMASGTNRFGVNDVWNVNITYNLANNVSQTYTTTSNSLTINDTAPMTINISSPQNTTYPDMFDLNFTASDSDNVSSCKYELDGVNTTISCSNQTRIILSGWTGHSLKLWINDSWNYWYSSNTIYFSSTNCANLNVENSTYTLIGNIVSTSDPCFTISANNVTFNGQGYTISGTGPGFYTAGGYTKFRLNNTVINTNGGSEGAQIYVIASGLTSSKIINNTILTNGVDGVVWNNNNNNLFENNTIRGDTSGGSWISGIYQSGTNTNLTGNLINVTGLGFVIRNGNAGSGIIKDNVFIGDATVFTMNDRGIAYHYRNNYTSSYSCMDASAGCYAIGGLGTNNVIENSTINTPNTFEVWVDAASNATNVTNIITPTGQIKIGFYGATNWFKYRNSTANNVYLITKLSAQSYINRTIQIWNQTVVNWTDSSTGLTGTYYLTGLSPSTSFSVLKNGSEVSGFVSNSVGDTPSFSVSLNANTVITVLPNIGIPPVVNIQSPVEGRLYNTSVNLNYTTFDLNGISQCKYELDGVNTTLAVCQNTTLTLSNGIHSIKVWANDSANNWGVSNTITFGVGGLLYLNLTYIDKVYEQYNLVGITGNSSNTSATICLSSTHPRKGSLYLCGTGNVSDTWIANNTQNVWSNGEQTSAFSIPMLYQYPNSTNPVVGNYLQNFSFDKYAIAKAFYLNITGVQKTRRFDVFLSCLNNSLSQHGMYYCERMVDGIWNGLGTASLGVQDASDVYFNFTYNQSSVISSANITYSLGWTNLSGDGDGYIEVNYFNYSSSTWKTLYNYTVGVTPLPYVATNQTPTDGISDGIIKYWFRARSRSDYMFIYEVNMTYTPDSASYLIDYPKNISIDFLSDGSIDKQTIGDYINNTIRLSWFNDSTTSKSIQFNSTDQYSVWYFKMPKSGINITSASILINETQTTGNFTFTCITSGITCSNSVSSATYVTTLNSLTNGIDGDWNTYTGLNVRWDAAYPGPYYYYQTVNISGFLSNYGLLLGSALSFRWNSSYGYGCFGACVSRTHQIYNYSSSSYVNPVSFDANNPRNGTYSRNSGVISSSLISNGEYRFDYGVGDDGGVAFAWYASPVYEHMGIIETQMNTNYSFDVGFDGSIEDNYVFTSSGNRQVNFTQGLTNYLANCTADSLGLCTVPVYLSSKVPATYVLSNLEINYTINPISLSASAINAYITDKWNHNFSDNFSALNTSQWINQYPSEVTLSNVSGFLFVNGTIGDTSAAYSFKSTNSWQYKTLYARANLNCFLAIDPSPNAKVKFGFVNDTGAETIMIRCGRNSNYELDVDNGPINTIVDMGLASDGNTFHEFKIVWTPTTILAYIDNAHETTLSVTIPSNTMLIGEYRMLDENYTKYDYIYVDDVSIPQVTLPIKISSSTAGNITASYMLDYEGFGSYQWNLTNADGSVVYDTRILNVTYSGINVTYPNWINKALFYLPTNSSKNVSLYGQTRTLGVNVNASNYKHTTNVTLSVNQTIPCLNLTYSTNYTNPKTIIPVAGLSIGQLAVRSNSSWWLWVDAANCNSTLYQLKLNWKGACSTCW